MITAKVFRISVSYYCEPEAKFCAYGKHWDHEHTCTKSRRFEVLSISIPRSSIILSCTIFFSLKNSIRLQMHRKINKQHHNLWNIHLCKELFVYCKPNTSNSLHACTQLIQLFVLLPIYTFDRGIKSGWVTSNLLHISERLISSEIDPGLRWKTANKQWHLSFYSVIMESY